MTKTSGYEQQITIWVPCHPNDPDSMRHADALLSHVSDMLQTSDILDSATVLIGRRKWYSRRRRDESPQSAGGIARAEALSSERRTEIARAAAEPANEQAAQDSRAAGEGQTSPAAGEEMPEYMRRVPRSGT